MKRNIGFVPQTTPPQRNSCWVKGLNVKTKMIKELEHQKYRWLFFFRWLFFYHCVKDLFKKKSQEKEWHYINKCVF